MLWSKENTFHVHKDSASRCYHSLCFVCLHKSLRSSNPGVTVHVVEFVFCVRNSERERENVCECERDRECVHVRENVCMRERGRKRER